jgi:gliding motility-associated lipoprotein GldH
MYYKKLAVIIGLLCCLQACIKSNSFTKTYFIDKHAWRYNDPKQFSFNITDTNARYILHFQMANHNNYAFSNIWMRMTTQFPDGKIDTTRLEVPLALPSGQWLGTEANNIVEHSSGITPNDAPLKFTETGLHTITLYQDMRVNPLKEVYSVGLSIEKQ